MGRGGRVLMVYLFPINVNHSSTEFDSDSEIMDGLKSLVRELQQKTTFSDTCITDNNILEEKCVTHPKHFYGFLWGFDFDKRDGFRKGFNPL